MSNNYEIAEAPPSMGAITAVESSRAVQQVQAAMIIAKRFPRNEKDALDRIINDCTRLGLANQAVYQYAKGGQNIDGPSIRLAEAIAKRWGNIESGWQEIDRATGSDGVTYSVVQAFAWDLESNNKAVRNFNVRHWRDTKKGGYKITDDRENYELMANMAARRQRACILAVIPGDVVEEALKQCEVTMAADADTGPEAQKKIIESFAKFKVSKEQLETRIQRRMDAITPAQVIALRKIMSSLKDGMSTPDEWFEKEKESARTESVDPTKPPEGKGKSKSKPDPDNDGYEDPSDHLP